MKTQATSMAVMFIFLTIVFTVIGQLCVKQGMLKIGTSPSEFSLLPMFIFRTFTSIWIILGLVCAVIAAITWSLAVSRSDLSFAYPFMALAIVLVLALSSIIFGEIIPITRWLGIIFVCVGIYLASRS